MECLFIPTPSFFGKKLSQPLSLARESMCADVTYPDLAPALVGVERVRRSHYNVLDRFGAEESPGENPFGPPIRQDYPLNLSI